MLTVASAAMKIYSAMDIVIEVEGWYKIFFLIFKKSLYKRKENFMNSLNLIIQHRSLKVVVQGPVLWPTPYIPTSYSKSSYETFFFAICNFFAIWKHNLDT
jgi:hypothetical protein